MTLRRSALSAPARAAAGGYVLLEVIIALTVFAVAVAGLSSVLHSSLDSANSLRRSAAIRRGLEALLIEAKQKPKREEMALTATDPALGMEYRSQLEEVKWTNRKGEPVSGLYILRVEARDTRAAAGGTLEPTDVAEVYVYRP
jgi:type II secretory pathway component PulJ